MYYIMNGVECALNRQTKYAVSLIQMQGECFQVEQNLKKAERMVREAALSGAKLVCLPEGFLTGYPGKQLGKAAALAERIDGPHIRRLILLAKELNIYLLLPFFEKVQNGIKNSACLIDDKGKVIGHYSKTHLIAQEKGIIQPGERFEIWHTPLGTISCLICYDICFPECVRELALRGVQLILIPAAWGSDRYYTRWWDLNIACRALDNLVYTVGVNQTGVCDGKEFAGHSQICDPCGHVICISETANEEILTAEIDLDKIEEERAQNTVIQDRREELYIFHNLNSRETSL